MDDAQKFYIILWLCFTLQIIGDKDADGFYWGECNGVGGFVPCNMVSEVQVDDDRVLQDMATTNKVSLEYSIRIMVYG